MGKTLVIVAPSLVAALLLRFHWGGGGVEFPYSAPWAVPRRAWVGSMDSYRDIWRNLFGFLGRGTLPPEGGALRFNVAPSMLFRGDNTIYLYRLSRRADPAPWLELGAVHVRRE